MQPPVGVRRSTRYFPELESLRGIAILLVLGFHLAAVLQIGDARATWPWMAFVYGGHTGVSLFFIISAFLLSLPFLREAATGKPVIRSQYYARRALRILPLYWTAVLVASVLCAGHARDVLRAVPYLLFLNSMAGVVAPLYPYSAVWWSLATEVQFYLVLPLLPWLMRSRRGQWLGGALLVLYAAVYAMICTGTIHANSVEGQLLLLSSILGRGPLFASGICAAWLYSRYGDGIRAGAAQAGWIRLGGADMMLLAALMALAYLLRLVAVNGYFQMEHEWPAWHVLEGLLWTSVVLLLLLAPLRTKRLFSNRVLNVVGLLSYSIYMIHFPLAVFTGRLLYGSGPRPAGLAWLAGLGPMALITGLCLALSTVTYWLIERPFLVRKQKLDR